MPIETNVEFMLTGILFCSISAGVDKSAHLLAIRNSKAGASREGFSDLIEGLSRKRQEVIRPVLEHPRDHVLLSIRGLAQKLGTDPATMLRIVREMGFGSYRDFQRFLHELSIVLATPLEVMQTTTASDSDIPSHIRESLELDLKNLQGLQNSLDAKRLSALARRLHLARRILILGGDLATSLATFLEYNLTVLGLTALTAVTPGRVVHLTRTVGKRDVVVAISFRRGLRQTVEGLQEGRARGAYCVGITDTFISPVARFAHECFVTSIESPSFAGSYVTPMALLNVILVACANYRRARTIALLKEADTEQRTGFRWYRGD
jgi:RpiR family carbohydrate utilization transcriptional regulator